MTSRREGFSTSIRSPLAASTQSPPISMLATGPPYTQRGYALRVPPISHDELIALLTAHELPETMADDAVWGLALLPGGTGRSRLGGRPEIAGEWPLNEGRGLTHLASIALDELPDFPGRGQLPAEGTLVFFVDFSLESEGWGPADGRASVLELIHVAPGTPAATAEPPHEPRGRYDVPVLLNERRVRFEPVLTMRYLDDVPDEIWDAYDAFAEALDTPDHLLLGEPVFIQEDPREDGELSLLQLNWDEELRFMFGDGGEVTFYGSPEDLRDGRWERVKAMPDSS